MPKGVNLIKKPWSKILDEVEKLLLIWINEKQFAGNSVTEAIIGEKAKNLNSNLLTLPNTSAGGQD